uniref:Dedicator of cytokinesis 3 n=1 Tax=Hucho hucho TaxID=62062 RepID=A0A4W5MY81_9TELE
ICTVGRYVCLCLIFRLCETVVPLEDPIITETTSTLQEWGVLWKQLYVKHKVDLFHKLRHVMNELIDLRRQLIQGHLAQDQTREIKRHITVRLDWGNEHLGLDLVPRKEFEMVDPDHISASELYKMRHGDGCRVPVQHHLFINLKSFTYNTISEEADVFFSLYDTRDNKQIRYTHSQHSIHTQDTLTQPLQAHVQEQAGPVLEREPQDILFYFYNTCDNEQNRYWREGYRTHTCLTSWFDCVRILGDTRNDLYLTLERGDFERGGKSVQKNIEVTVYVLYADGDTLKDCISLGSGEPNTSEHQSFVLYHNNSPRWSEMIKLPIPIDRFRGSHLRFEFRHCSTKDKGEKKLFGFSFTPLMREDGTTLSDESHELYVYKCDENATFSNQGLYLSMPCCKEDFNSCPNLPSTLPFQRNPKETFWVSTQLCSTKLTQNVDLLALLNWKAHTDRVLDILGRLRHINGEEIVKFLRDVLDTLFCLLDDNTDKYGPLVFQSLVFIINLLRDSRFYHFRPVMEAYIQNHFAGALAYKELIRCLKWYMDRSAEVVRQDHIQEAMKALEYLFKFIVQSRILYSRATCGMEEDQFRASIQELFQSIRFVLSLDSRSSETLVFTQAALLNSFPDIFDELLQMFTVQEVAEYVRGTLGSMPSTVDIGQSMDVVKLQSIARTVESRLFFFPESRSILLPVVLHHIHLHLRQQRELLICSGILTSIFSIIKTSSMRFSSPTLAGWIFIHYMEQILYIFCNACNFSNMGVFLPVQGEYVSTLLSLLRQMTEIHFHHLLNNFHSKEELKEFLLKIFCVFRNLMKLTIFPRDWSVMRLLTSHVIVATTQYLSPALHKNFSEADFDFKVWNSFFSLTVLYINQPSLQLEPLTQAKRKKVLDKYGDMRVMMAYELFSMWQKLGENKPHFIPGMMGPFLGVTLVPQSEVRNIMIPIFHDMMDWEQRKNGNFKLVEAELMDKLESMVADGKGDGNHRELFGLLLLEKIEQETWRETGISFVTSVTRLMERLLDYRDCMKGDEMENKKIGGSSNLMNFYKSEINKEDMYIRYIHKLCDLHLHAEDYTEAAFTLLLYWELLHWEDRPLREFLHYPTQSEWQRKEGLSRKVLHYFNKGKCWEYGISLCRELAFQYETLYDYQSLSWIRKMEAAYYDNIIEQQRIEPEFFRMGFYGRKYPFFLRNKEFVCRGYNYERLEDFQQRMLGEFPQAIAMQHPNQPDDALLQSDVQYLQIYAVTPVSDITDVPQLERVPEKIKSFYRINNVARFHYDRPFHKGPKDRENEFRSLWIERTTLILSRPLPGISRWAEVERRELLEVSPLENAVYVVENKTQELRTLISQYQHRQHHGNINPLSMLLNGVIDAAVNGGIARYQEAFFEKDYMNSHAEDTEKITQLKDLMQEQVHILGVGLAVHEKLVHPEMRPLHKKLIDQFHMMRTGLHQVSGSTYSSVCVSSCALMCWCVHPCVCIILQPSPSSSSLSSIRSTSSQVINSAPSSARGECHLHQAVNTSNSSLSCSWPVVHLTFSTMYSTSQKFGPPTHSRVFLYFYCFQQIWNHVVTKKVLKKIYFRF